MTSRPRRQTLARLVERPPIALGPSFVESAAQGLEFREPAFLSASRFAGQDFALEPPLFVSAGEQVLIRWRRGRGTARIITGGRRLK